jgi:hypothetical protein
MKRVLSVVTAAALVCGAAVTASAQQAQPAQPDVHVVVAYFKAAPGQAEAYREYLTTVSKKFYQEMLKEQPGLMHWSAAQVMYPGEHGDYDFVSAAVYAGPPPEPTPPSDAMYQKITGATRADTMKRLDGLRTMVGSELLRRIGAAGPAGVIAEGDYRVVALVKVKPGMGSEFTGFVGGAQQGVLQVRAADAEFKSWSAWTRVFPAGGGERYDALTATYFKDLASAVKGLDGAKGAEAFAKAHPGKSYANYINDMRDYAELAGRGLHRVVAVVDRAAAPAAKTSAQ